MRTHTYPTAYISMTDDDMKKWSYAPPRGTTHVRIPLLTGQAGVISIRVYERIRNRAQMKNTGLAHWPAYLVSRFA